MFCNWFVLYLQDIPLLYSLEPVPTAFWAFHVFKLRGTEPKTIGAEPSNVGMAESDSATSNI
jgi:hypothetical protein